MHFYRKLHLQAGLTGYVVHRNWMPFILCEQSTVLLCLLLVADLSHSSEYSSVLLCLFPLMAVYTVDCCLSEGFTHLEETRNSSAFVRKSDLEL